jgi:hypothetical protein
VPLKDGSILGMGGKSTDIDGYMPKSVSKDGGRTWDVSRTDFAALASNQRPTLIRLKSGRLFFAGDYQDFNGRQPSGITQHGSYVALSDDEGATWHVKPFPGALPHESKTIEVPEHWARNKHEHPTLGYAVARQAPNGVIHLITSMNHPSQHFEMNEAWILQEGADVAVAETNPAAPETHEERYANGALKARWSLGRHPSGQYMLDGPVLCQAENGTRLYEATYDHGSKTGSETLWDRDGRKVWEWERAGDGAATWTQWWPNGQMKARSTWRNGRCEGVAERWTADGTLLSKVVFREGIPEK